MAGHAFDRSLALRQTVDAAEAHADFGVALQLQHPGTDVRISATPAASLRLDVIAAHSGSRHHDPALLRRDAAPDADAASLAMANVWIPAPLRSLCGGAGTLEVDGATLGEVLRALEVRCPGFLERVVEDGRLRPELAVAIDGEAQSFALQQEVRADADIAIIPAISGG